MKRKLLYLFVMLAGGGWIPAGRGAGCGPTSTGDGVAADLRRGKP